MTPNELEGKADLSKQLYKLSCDMEFIAQAIDNVYGENSASLGLLLMAAEVLNVHNEIENEILSKIESFK